MSIPGIGYSPMPVFKYMDKKYVKANLRKSIPSTHWEHCATCDRCISKQCADEVVSWNFKERKNIIKGENE